MPNLNNARISPSGLTINDSLYVFGGANGVNSIERLNIKLNMQRQGDKFEVLDVKLPIAASDIGLIPCLNPHEVLLVGGYSYLDQKSLNTVLKLTVKPTGSRSGMDGSQEHIEHQIEEVDGADAMKADFFMANNVVTMDGETEACVIYGAQYKHYFNGASFGESVPI